MDEVASDAPEQQAWRRQLAEAARRAADELRLFDDGSASQLVSDLEELHARLTDSRDGHP